MLEQKCERLPMVELLLLVLELARAISRKVIVQMVKRWETVVERCLWDGVVVKERELE